MYRIQSGRTQHVWSSLIYSILTLTAAAVLFIFALPIILAIVAVALVGGIITYWWIQYKWRKMQKARSAASRAEGEYVEFEIIEED